ncbi:ankyrin repeat-containing domain protein [Coprinopsis sp. MPI-PUGE-AT-0042]|nr:ankyrin repeat-containing domain protein [Coprinopsis sp. MPI-PUGE-AT-0042]
MGFKGALKRLLGKAPAERDTHHLGAGGNLAHTLYPGEDHGTTSSLASAVAQPHPFAGGIVEVQCDTEFINSPEAKEKIEDLAPPHITSDGLASPQTPDLEVAPSHLTIPPPINLEQTPNLSPPVYVFEGASNIIQGGTFNAAGRDIVYNIQTSEGQRENMKKMLKWLSPINFRPAFEENLARWTPGTGSHVLNSVIFQQWRRSRNAVLCGIGMPGAGKTVLASLVISTIAEVKGSLVAFIYCRYTEPLTVQEILAAVVRQVIEDHQYLACLLQPLFDRCNLRDTRPTQADLLDILGKLFGSFPIVHSILDGLDEAQPDAQYELTKALTSLGGNLLITSRPLPLLNQILPAAIFFDVIADKDDIASLVAQRIQMNPALLDLITRAGVKQAVISKIGESSQGMFLHAALQIEMVRRCTNLKSVMKQLDTMPAELENMYSLTIQRIEAQSDSELAKRALLWVIYAEAPLTLEELRHAVACTPENDPFDDDALVPESILLSAFGGLISTEGKRDITRLIHYTAKAALKSILAKDYPNPHSILARGCIIYLNTYGINQTTVERLMQSHKDMPFLSYALQHWALHARRCDGFSPLAISPSCGRSFLLSCQSFPLGWRPGWIPLQPPTMATSPFHVATFYNILHLVGDVIRPGEDETIFTPDGIANASDWLWPRGRSPLMFSVSRGHIEAVDWLLAIPKISMNSQSMDGNTALHLACARGDQRISITQRLLQHRDLEPNLTNNKGHTPLLTCLLPGSVKGEVLGLIMQHPKLDINKYDVQCRTTLLHACQDGLFPAASCLLTHPNVDVNAPTSNGWTPLMVAVDRCHHAAAHALLDHPNIRVNQKNSNGDTVLMIASYRQNLGIAKRLMFYSDVEVNARRHGRGHSALTLAGSEEMAMVLLEIPGIDVNAKGDGIPMIAIASANGWERAMSRLVLFPELDASDLPALANTEVSMLAYLDRPGVDINACSEPDYPPIIAASTRGWHRAVKRLLDFPNIRMSTVNMALVSRTTEEVMIQLLDYTQIQINTRSRSDRTALMTASQRGWSNAVRRLLARPDIDADAHDNNGDTAILLAHKEDIMLQLLAVDGVDINRRSRLGKSPLVLACEVGWETAVEVMVAHPSIEINATDSDGTTALMSAAQEGSDRIVQRLLGGSRLDLNIQDINGMTALMIASKLSYPSIIKTLAVHPGVDANARDKVGKTALLLSACEDDMQRVLDIPGVRGNDGDDSGRTPLMHAAENDWGGVIARLLEDPAVDANAMDASGWTALAFAIRRGNEQAFRNLVGCPRVDVNAGIEEARWTPLMSVFFGGRTLRNLFVSLLLQRPDIDVNATDTQGKTALAWAVEEGQSLPVVIHQLLCTPSLDQNMRDSMGRTYLMIAAQGHSPAARFTLLWLLASSSTDVNAMDNDGKTALGLVRELLQRSEHMYPDRLDFLEWTEQLLCAYPDLGNVTIPHLERAVGEDASFFSD